MTQRTGPGVGVSQVVRLRLEPSAAQVELLRGYCGKARAASNALLFQVRANLGQRAAQKTYDITGADLTPALSWHRLGPGEAAPSEPGAVAAVARTAPVPGAGTGPRTTSRPRWPGGTAVRRRFPRYCSGDHEVPVLEWTKGTALLPVLELLQDEDKRAEFMAAYGNALLSAQRHTAMRC